MNTVHISQVACCNDNPVVAREETWVRKSRHRDPAGTWNASQWSSCGTATAADAPAAAGGASRNAAHSSWLACAWGSAGAGDAAADGAGGGCATVLGPCAITSGLRLQHSTHASPRGNELRGRLYPG